MLLMCEYKTKFTQVINYIVKYLEILHLKRMLSKE